MSAALKLREYPKPPELRKVRGYKNHRPNPKGVLLLLIAFFVGFLMLNSDNKKDEIKEKDTENKEALSEFVERVLKNRQGKKELFFFGNVSENMQQILKTSTKMNFKDFKWVIGRYDILHIDNKHGNLKKEELRGQINVTKKDYQKIYSIIDVPDNIELSINKKSGEKVLKLTKNINEKKYIYIVSISTKKWRLKGKTLYIKKASTK